MAGKHGRPYAWENFLEIAKFVFSTCQKSWVARHSNWFPESVRRVGRPAYTSGSMLEHCSHKEDGKLATTCPRHVLFDERSEVK